MIASAYEKEADVKKHFYFVNFKDMASVKYKFAGTHIHHSIEMVFCYSGTMKANINKKEINLSKGDVLIINPLDWHDYEYVENASCFIIVASREYFEDLIDDDSKEFANKVTLDSSAYEKLYSLCLSNCDERAPISYISKKSFILNIFFIIEPFGLFRKKQFIENKDICKKIISFISEHFNEELTIADVATQFGYSRNYFSCLFNKLVGENFNTFLNRYRSEKVKEMKKDNPNMLMEDVIRACGFSSRETYYRHIRKYQ